MRLSLQAFVAGAYLLTLPALASAQLDDQQTSSRADHSRQDTRQPYLPDASRAPDEPPALSPGGEAPPYQTRREDTSRFDSRAYSSGIENRETPVPERPE